MELRFEPQVAALAAAGLILGLWMLVRGMSGYRTATLIGDTGTSTIRTLAAGEVRVTGVIEAAEVTLVSPFQSQPCVYYRATVDGDEDGPGMADSTEERAVGFRVRDASGDIRVFPRGARWDAPLRFDERTGTFGDEPSGLLLRTGGATAVPVASLDRTSRRPVQRDCWKARPRRPGGMRPSRASASGVQSGPRTSTRPRRPCRSRLATKPHGRNDGS